MSGTVPHIYFIDDGRNWYVILFLGFFLISLPAGLIVRMKNEDNPAHNILLVLFLGVCMVLFLDGTMMNQKGFYFILGALFLSLYQICSNIIIYKAKKAYDSEN